MGLWDGSKEKEYKYFLSCEKKMRVVQRLEFDNVFPEENPKEIMEYLVKISREILLKFIGFSTTRDQPNYTNIFSNPTTQADIDKRVAEYGRKNNLPERPILVSREASLMFAEIVLAKRDELLKETDERNVDDEELNLFKAYLLVNKNANEKQNLGNAEHNIDRFVDMFMAMGFASADIGNSENIDLEFAKTLYAMLVKFEYLLEFVQREENEYMAQALIDTFGQEDLEGLNYQVKTLASQLLKLKHENAYIINPDRQDHIDFLKCLTSSKIEPSADFTNLKIFPIYEIEEGRFSLVDYFYVIDKFFKSIKFTLKEAFIKHHKLKPKDSSFFSYYNLHFSEDVVMKNVLDDIFHWPYQKKRQEAETKDSEPDYYVRHNNRIYLFENKDILVAAGIKSSSDIDEIETLLKKKFVHDGERHVGIGQLITSIKQIVDNKFPYDDYVNKKKNVTIYPILLVSDRIFEIPGMNYKLNKWYIELVKERLGDAYNPNFIRPLTFVDIDTLIYWTPYLVKDSKYFREIIEDHHKEMNREVKINNPDLQQGEIQARKAISKRLSAISYRAQDFTFPVDLLVDKFRDILPEN